MDQWTDFVDDLNDLTVEELTECLVLLELYLAEEGIYVSDQDKEKAMQRLGLLGKEF